VRASDISVVWWLSVGSYLQKRSCVGQQIDCYLQVTTVLPFSFNMSRFAEVNEEQMSKLLDDKDSQHKKSDKAR